MPPYQGRIKGGCLNVMRDTWCHPVGRPGDSLWRGSSNMHVMWGIWN
jgi:hypothetical protein